MATLHSGGNASFNKKEKYASPNLHPFSVAVFVMLAVGKFSFKCKHLGLVVPAVPSRRGCGLEFHGRHFWNCYAESQHQ